MSLWKKQITKKKKKKERKKSQDFEINTHKEKRDMRESITVQEKGSSQQSKKDNKCKATHKFSSKVRERWTTDEARQCPEL